MSKVKVSVLCITYNHEKYIRQCLDSILSQQTNFEYEVIIHDDASTDNTVNIINEYRSKDSRVKLIAQTKNQYQQGVRGMFMKFLLPLVKSKYIAICEGDDYFNDNLKLQRQADFLDAHPDHSICFHPVNVVTENSTHKRVFPSMNQVEKGINFETLLKCNFIQTNSVMYRRIGYAELSQANFMPSDWYLHIYHARVGKIGFLEKAMASYRRHSAGVWSFDNDEHKLRTVGDMHMLMYVETLKLLPESDPLRINIYNNLIGIANRTRKLYL